MNTWIAAWLFSVISSGGIYFFARKGLLPRADSLMIAMAAFPAPFFQAISGRGSFVYGIDLVTPFAVYFAYETWRSSHPKLRVAAASLLAAAGIAPFVIVVLFSRDIPDLLFTGINLYRLLGAMALMVRCNSLRRRDPSLFVNWLHAFSWVALSIALAMAAKTFTGIDSDVMTLVDSYTNLSASGDSEGAFNVMGLFRASIGIFGVLAVCAYSANAKRALHSQLFSAAGAVAGLSIILLSGSKTSLFVAIAVLVLKFLAFGARQFAVVIVVVVLLGIVMARLDMNEVMSVLPRSLTALVESDGQARESMDIRTTTWQDCLDSVYQNPAILFGVAPRESMPTSRYGVSTYWPGYFHNEYLSIVMLGGVWTAFGYLFGLGMLLRLLLPHRSGSPAERFAVLAIASGLVEGFTVVHLQPSLLFGATASVAAAIYGVGCPNRASAAVARGRLAFVVRTNMMSKLSEQYNNLPQRASSQPKGITGVAGIPAGTRTSRKDKD